jgi:hypothetical protein
MEAQLNALYGSRLSGFYQYGLQFDSGNFYPFDLSDSSRSFWDSKDLLLTTGNGTGSHAGLWFEYPILPMYEINLQLRAGYSTFSSDFSTLESFAIEDSVAGRPTQGKFSHNITTNIAQLTLAPTVVYEVIRDIFISAGVQGRFILSEEYRSWEQFVEPAVLGVFEDTGTRIRNNQTRPIPNISSAQWDAILSLRLERPLNKKKVLWFAPEITYVAGLSNLTSDTDITTHRFQFGLSIFYYFTPSQRNATPLEPAVTPIRR